MHAATLAPLPFVQSLDHGIHVIDTGFHRPVFDASYLIVERGRAAFVDTGTNDSVPRLLAALGAAGLAPEALRTRIKALTKIRAAHPALRQGKRTTLSVTMLFASDFCLSSASAYRARSSAETLSTVA